MTKDKLMINETFAKQHDKYRKNEAVHKLENVYGNFDDESSSSESEDDAAEAINPKFEKKFFHVLAQLKSKDPALYEEDEKIFDKDSSSEESNSKDEETSSKKRTKKRPLYVRKYETNMALEGEKVYDEMADNAIRHSMDAPDSYYGELAAIKKSFAEATEEHDKIFRDADGNDALLSTKSIKKVLETPNKETMLDDLDDYWKKSNLDESEKYLRDYLLNKKYIVESESDDEKIIPPAVLLEEEADFVEKQEIFEYKYNTRFEKPDHHFVKSYPRVIASSVRRKDDRRIKKRLQREKRKGDQKKKKTDELARLKRLKRKSILEKIELLKEASGNTDIGFSEKDINEDFDPETYDKRMQELFDDEFYGDADDEKPQFADVEDYYEEEDGDDDDPNRQEYEDDDFDEQLPACEQPDFNMDCEYEETTKKSKRQLKRESKIENKKKKSVSDNCDNHLPDADYPQSSSYYEYDDSLPACEQPDFVMDCEYIPEKKKSKRQLKKERKGMTEEEFLKTMNEQKSTIGEKSVNEHLEEYYAMDYDDIIGDMPCRYRYRSVAPTNFALSTEDILLADNATLNTWCPLNRVIAHRLPEEEFYLRQKYARKARSKRTKLFGKFYEGLKDDKKNSKEAKAEKERKSDQISEENSSDENLKQSIQTEKTKKNVKSKEIDETAELCPGSIPQKRTKLSARQRRRKRELEERKKRKEEFARTGKWVKQQKSKSFQRLARIEPITLKAYGLKPKRVLRKAKSELDNRKKKRK